MLIAVTVRDVVTGYFSPPLFVLSKEAYLRALRSYAVHPEVATSVPMFMHPSDHRVFIVGEFNDETGLLDAYGDLDCIDLGLVSELLVGTVAPLDVTVPTDTTQP